MITIPQILLILVVLCLFAATFYACFRFNKGPLSVNSLEDHLQLMKFKFANHSPIDPEQERNLMEGLLNNIKTSCSQKAISQNEELKALFLTNCQSVDAMKNTAPITTKTSWLKYNALMKGFNEFYFPVAA